MAAVVGAVVGGAVLVDAVVVGAVVGGAVSTAESLDAAAVGGAVSASATGSVVLVAGAVVAGAVVADPVEAGDDEATLVGTRVPPAVVIDPVVWLVVTEPALSSEPIVVVESSPDPPATAMTANTAPTVASSPMDRPVRFRGWEVGVMSTAAGCARVALSKPFDDGQELCSSSDVVGGVGRGGSGTGGGGGRLWWVQARPSHHLAPPGAIGSAYQPGGG